MDRIDLGRKGENEAVRYLRDRGWTILARNVRVGRKEVDVIASRGSVLAFVEVKCRRGTGWGAPAEAITPVKQRDIAAVARGWLRGRTLPRDTIFRFDAVSVFCAPGQPLEVLHIPDAWRLE